MSKGMNKMIYVIIDDDSEKINNNELEKLRDSDRDSMLKSCSNGEKDKELECINNRLVCNICCISFQDFTSLEEHFEKYHEFDAALNVALSNDGTVFDRNAVESAHISFSDPNDQFFDQAAEGYNDESPEFDYPAIHSDPVSEVVRNVHMGKKNRAICQLGNSEWLEYPHSVVKKRRFSFTDAKRRIKMNKNAAIQSTSKHYTDLPVLTSIFNDKPGSSTPVENNRNRGGRPANVMHIFVNDNELVQCPVCFIILQTDEGFEAHFNAMHSLYI